MLRIFEERKQRIMKKKVLSMFLVMAMAGTLLAGCGGGSDDSASEGSGED